MNGQLQFALGDLRSIQVGRVRRPAHNRGWIVAAPVGASEALL